MFTHFLKELELGYTPNPDVLCNREIKFKALFNKAMALGADAMATGHYCQTRSGLLFRGSDPGKDQSYFLHMVKEQVLSDVLFPVGHMQKSAVRELAKEAGLPLHSKKDSTGICFIGERNFRQFLERYIPNEKGPIESVEGRELGEHDGIFYYTIGQRKGLRIGGEGEAWFVVGKDRERNALIVAQGKNHPALFAPGLTATDLSWIGPAPTLPLRCHAKVRYRQQDQPCTVEKQGDRLYVHFDRPQRAITPRQSVVFYQGERCLGGALIERALDREQELLQKQILE